MRIFTTHNEPFYVDETDYAFTKQWDWYFNIKGHVTRSERDCNGKKKHVFLHLEIAKRMNIYDENYLIDHKDQNKSNNLRNNLRIATYSQNRINSKINCNNTTGYRNVYFNKQKLLYFSAVMVNGLKVFLGYFKTPEEAALAYNKAALKYFGEFAILNEIKICQ